jgi:hypothetical protein
MRLELTRSLLLRRPVHYLSASPPPPAQPRVSQHALNQAIADIRATNLLAHYWQRHPVLPTWHLYSRLDSGSASTRWLTLCGDELDSPPIHAPRPPDQTCDTCQQLDDRAGAVRHFVAGERR